MTYDNLKQLIELGKRPLICFTEGIHNIDSQFEKDMLAEVIDIDMDIDGECCKITVSEEKYQEFNTNMERPIWYDSTKGEYCKKFSEEDAREKICIIYDDPNNIENFIIKDGNMDLFNEFLKSGESSYVEWLEEQLNLCRALIS